MSIINEALKKAQREWQRVPDSAAWVQSAPSGGGARPRRGKALWVAAAALFALSVGATLNAWIASPTADLGTGPKPARSAADAAPGPAPLQPTESAETRFRPVARAAPVVASQRPVLPSAAAVSPVQAIRVAAARRPSLAAADYLSRGNGLYRQGDYQDAIDMYQAALALDPADVKARNNLGNAYMQLAMDDRAVAAFEEALRLDRTYSLAYYNLACVHGRAGDVAGAADYLRQAIALKPEARNWAMTDADFAAVRDAPQFRRLLEP